MPDAQAGPSVSRVNVESCISQQARRYKASAIRSLYPLEKRPGMVSLLAGKPNASTFPFESISLKLKGRAEPLVIEGNDLDEALQYGMTAGLPRLVQWLSSFQRFAHQRGDGDEEGWRLSIGVGSQDVINKAFRALVDEEDPVLLESPTYSGILGLLTPLQLDMVEVASDDTGLDPASLKRVMEEWPAGKKRPKVLYTCPTGSNPTGRSATEAKKREILVLCKQYDLLVFEDAAYDYLTWVDGPRTPSLFELEPKVNGETGRVVRFDSFSKLVSSGMRLGFMTAAKSICDAVDLMSSNTNLQASSTAQAILYALLNDWGHQGFLDHCRGVSEFYKKQCAMFEVIAHKHLNGLAEWVSPVAGMFLFLQLRGVDDSLDLIRTKAVEKGVIALPGVAFMPSGSKTPFVRVSFSLASEQDAELAFSRLREVLLEAKADMQKAEP